MKGLSIWLVLLLIVRHQAQTAPPAPTAQAQSIGTPEVLQAATSGQTVPIINVDFNSFGNRLIALTNNSIVVWQRSQQNGQTSYKIRQTISVAAAPTTAAISANGALIASAGNNSNVTIWKQNQTGEFVQLVTFTLQGSRANERITTLKLDKIAFFLYVGTSAGQIFFYDVSTDTPTLRQRLLRHLGPVLDLGLGRTRLVSSGDDGTNIQVWRFGSSLTTYIPSQTIRPLGGFAARSVKLSSDESVLAVGQANGNIAIYTLASNNQNYVNTQNMTGVHTGGVNDITLSNDGTKMVSTGSQNTVFWQRTLSDTYSGNYVQRRRTTDAGSSVVFDRRHRVAVGLANSVNGQVKIFPYSTSCNQIPQSSGQSINEVDCLCNPGFYWIMGGCRQLNCQKLQFSLGFDNTTNGCFCQPDYQWFDNRCIRNCNTVPNSAMINEGGSQCVCRTGYYWNGLQCALILRAGQATTFTQSEITSGTTGTTATTGTIGTIGTIGAAGAAGTVGTTGTAGTIGTTTVTQDGGTITTSSASGGVTTTTTTVSETTSLISSQPQINCANVPNSTGRNNDANSCVCSTGFVWNQFSCVPTQLSTSGGIAKTVTSQQQIIITTQVDCKNIPFTTGNNGAEACFCQPTYVWRRVGCFLDCKLIPNTTGSNQFKDCQCIPNFQWNGSNCVQRIELTSITLINDNRCREINGAIGSNGLGGCNCQPGLTWFSNQCVFNCTEIPNATPGMYAFSCPCDRNFRWSPVSKKCQGLKFQITDIKPINAPKCEDIPKARSSVQLPNSCLCQAGYIWMNATNMCARDCTKVPQYESFGPNGTCRCKLGFYYNNDLCVRGVLCKDIPNAIAVSPSDPFSCICSISFFWRNGQCVRNCSTVPNNLNGQNNGNDACVCAKDYIWRNGSCVSSLLPGGCSAVLYALGNGLLPNTCRCTPRFIWSVSACFINCSEYSFTTGRNVSIDDCECLPGRSWNKTTCNLALSCADIPNTRKGSSILRNVQACQCQSGYIWSPSQANCARNCANVSMSNGRNRNLTSCFCLGGYSWSQSNGACVMGIDCAPVKFAQSKDPNNARACICREGFFWDGPKERCSQDCGKLQNADGATSDGTCRCRDLYVYNNSTNICQTVCLTMEFSRKEADGDGRCLCIDKYQWSKSENKCVPKPSSKAGLILGLALGIPLGILGLLALGALSWYLCCKPQPLVSGMTAVPSVMPSPQMNQMNQMALGQLIADHPENVKINTVANGVAFQNGANTLARRQVTQYLAPPPVMAAPAPMIAAGPMQFINQQRVVGAPAFTTRMATGGVATQLIDAASIGQFDMGQIGSGVALGQVGSETALIANPGLPITTRVMDGMRTTSTAPKFTVVDTQTGNQAFLNYPFGAADD